MRFSMKKNLTLLLALALCLSLMPPTVFADEEAEPVCLEDLEEATENSVNEEPVDAPEYAEPVYSVNAEI